MKCVIVMWPWFAWHLRLWRESLSSAARFSPNAVIIKPYFRLQIELNFFDIYNISFKNTWFFVPFFSMAYLLLCAWFITDFLRIYLLYVCAFLNHPGIAVRTKMKRVLVFRVLVFQVLVFRVLGLSFPDTQKWTIVLCATHSLCLLEGQRN